MIIPFVAGALYCATPKVDNKTKEWNKTDQESLLYAQKEGCRKQNPSEPCVVIFQKVEENIYTVICGPEERRKDESKSE